MPESRIAKTMDSGLIVAGTKALIGMALVALACGLGGCAALHGLSGLFSGPQPVSVSEEAVLTDCHAQSASAQLLVFASADEVRDWQASRGIALLPAGGVPAGTLVVAEMGQQASGGYGLLVSQDADLRRDRTLVLKATFIAPDADHPGAPEASSPCALVSVPAGDYAAIELLDQNGATRAATRIMAR